MSSTSPLASIEVISEKDPQMKSAFSKSPEAAKRKTQVVVGLAILVTCLLFLLRNGIDFDSVSGGSLQHLHLDYFPETFRIAVIADLDQSSKVEGKNQWRSIYMTATLKRKGEEYDILWDKPIDVVTTHNEAGRGNELSELVRFQDRLYTFDDRTGIMYELVNPATSDVSATSKEVPHIVPRHIFMEGDGQSNDKGLKIEWATVKDGLLYVGSFGKEYTNNKGEIMHSNNLWVVTVTKDGIVTHIDWKKNYDAMRNALGYQHPGYLLHESVTWSPHHRKWFVLPRRMSLEPYDDKSDEKRGANFIIMASHDFSEISWRTAGKRTPERGYSSAKFLPGSRDAVLIALKSEENSELGTQKTYITIYGEDATGDWRVLLDEVELPIAKKFEGIEILSAN